MTKVKPNSRNKLLGFTFRGSVRLLTAIIKDKKISMNNWLRVTAIDGSDYECRMTILKADDTTITVTRPWRHHWTDGLDWATVISQWLSEAPETLEPYDGLAEWLRDADTERIDCWHCLSWLALLQHHRLAASSLSDKEKKRIASEFDSANN